MKYKVGDKVRVVWLEDYQTAFEIGDIVIIVREHPGGNPPYYSVDKGGGDIWWLSDNEIELYEEKPKMQKYTTEPIDYTGCHPVIAEHLKRGEAILCRGKDREDEDRVNSFMVYGYRKDAYYPYSGGLPGKDDDVYKYAEPIVKTRKALISPEKAVIKLIENGWVFRSNSELTNKPAGLSIAIYDLRRLQGQDQDVCTNFYPDYLFEEVD